VRKYLGRARGRGGEGGDQWRSVRIYLRITDMYFIYDETYMRDIEGDRRR
jgi:hypothetical protein